LGKRLVFLNGLEKEAEVHIANFSQHENTVLISDGKTNKTVSIHPMKRYECTITASFFQIYSQSNEIFAIAIIKDNGVPKYEVTPIHISPTFTADKIKRQSEYKEYNPRFTGWWRRIYSSYAFIMAGKCPMMAKYHWEVFKAVLYDMYWRSKEHVCPETSLGDGNAHHGCPGHPGNSHGTGMAIDVNYYTMGPNNHTQYVPPGETKTKIWSANNELINFDTGRNRVFCQSLHEVFPDVRIIMDRRIKAVVAPDLKYVQGDRPMHRNHHIHMHVSLGEKIKGGSLL
jgi:hypothetical protein